MRSHIPLAPSPILIEQRVEHRPQINPPRRTAVVGAWQQKHRCQNLPLFVSQIRQIPLPWLFLCRHVRVLLSSRLYANYPIILDFPQLKFPDSLSVNCLSRVDSYALKASQEWDDDWVELCKKWDTERM